MQKKIEGLNLTKGWIDANNHLGEQENGKKLSKKTSGHPHSFIKNADSIQQINVLLGMGSYGKVKQVTDFNGLVSVLKIEKNANESEYEILRTLGLSSGRSYRDDKTYTQMEYLGISVHQLLAPFELILANKKPPYSKILPHTFYLYLNNDEIVCVFQDKIHNIHEMILNPKDFGTEYARAKMMLNPSALDLFSKKPTDDHFPYLCRQNPPLDSEINPGSIILYSENEFLMLAYLDYYGRVKRSWIDISFKEKPRNFKIVVCEQRPEDWIVQDNIFYLYCNNGGLRGLFHKDDNFERIIIDKSNYFYKALQSLLNIENQTEKLEENLCKVTGLVHHELSDDRRLELSIDICLALAFLHEAGVAHLDLKPKNITIDSKDRVHIIDFGFSETNPEGIRIVKNNSPRGTPLYLPDYSYHSEEGLSRIQFDMIALKRVLFFDLEFYSKDGISKVSEKYRKANNVLTQDLVNKFKLGPYLITQNQHHGNDKMAARTLAAILICAKLGFSPRWYKNLVDDAGLCKMLIDFYSESKIVGWGAPQLERERQFLQILDLQYRRNSELEIENQKLQEAQFNTNSQLSELALDFQETMDKLATIQSQHKEKDEKLEQFPQIIAKLQDARSANEYLLNSKVRNTYIHSNRWHIFNLSHKLLEGNYKYENLRGDQLKLKILENLRMQIQLTSTLKELDDIKSNFQIEIKLLKQRQGLSYRLFGVRTGAMDIVEKMLEDKKEELAQFQAKQAKQEI